MHWTLGGELGNEVFSVSLCPQPVGPGKYVFDIGCEQHGEYRLTDVVRGRPHTVSLFVGDRAARDVDPTAPTRSDESGASPRHRSRSPPPSGRAGVGLAPKCQDRVVSRHGSRRSLRVALAPSRGAVVPPSPSSDTAPRVRRVALLVLSFCPSSVLNSNANATSVLPGRSGD